MNSNAALGAHAGIALVLVLTAAWLATRAQSWHLSIPRLALHVTTLAGLLMFQLFLGMLAWVFRAPKNSGDVRRTESIVIPTMHVVLGALLLAGFVLLWLRARRLLAGGAEISARGGRAEAILAAP
jgi:ABC-type xylose transport system permease subunit